MFSNSVHKKKRCFAFYGKCYFITDYVIKLHVLFCYNGIIYITIYNDIYSMQADLLSSIHGTICTHTRVNVFNNHNFNHVCHITG